VELIDEKPKGRKPRVTVPLNIWNHVAKLKLVCCCCHCVAVQIQKLILQYIDSTTSTVQLMQTHQMKQCSHYTVTILCRCRKQQSADVMNLQETCIDSTATISLVKQTHLQSADMMHLIETCIDSTATIALVKQTHVQSCDVMHLLETCKDSD
jgi:hypothetical protein